MNLPFSPTFFKKIDIFQQLMEYESQKDKKHLWEGVKALLIWSDSEAHQHLGSPVDTKHAINALVHCVKKSYITEAEYKRLEGSAPYIPESLITYEFATLYSDANPKNPRVRINRDGILAGQILVETSNLKNSYKYKRWFFDWWVLYYGAGLLLILGILNALVQLVKSLLKW